MDATALCGALTLPGAVASVRQGQIWTARERVRTVVPLAERTGERNVYWTAFGPANVAMYAVSVEVEAGETAEALRLAEQVEHDHSPSIERQVAFLIDQAKGYTQRRDYASALVLLHTASREAPEGEGGRTVHGGARSRRVSMSRGGAAPRVAPVGWVHLEGRYTIRWRRGDAEAYVLGAQQMGDHGMAGVLDTIPVSPSGWTDLAEVRLAGQRWLHRQRTQQSA